MWLTGYLQESYDGNFLLVCHQGPSGLGGGVRNDRKRVEWGMGSKRKRATMGKEVYHRPHRDGEGDHTMEVMEAGHSMDR